MLIVLYVVSALFLLIGIYFAIIHPFVCIIECALSKQLSGGKKTLWILATLITGSLAATFYTLFATRSARLRRFSLRAFSTGLVCFAVATCIFYADPKAQELASQFSVDGSAGPNLALNGTFDDIANSLSEFEASMAELEKTTQEIENLNFAVADDDSLESAAVLSELQSTLQDSDLETSVLVDGEDADLGSLLNEFSDAENASDTPDIDTLTQQVLASEMVDGTVREELANAMTTQLDDQNESQFGNDPASQEAGNLFGEFLSMFTEEQETEDEPSSEVAPQVVANAPAPSVASEPPSTSKPRTPTYVNTEATKVAPSQTIIDNRYVTSGSTTQRNGRTDPSAPSQPTRINRYRTSNAPAPQYIAPPRVKNRYTNQ